MVAVERLGDRMSTGDEVIEKPQSIRFDGTDRRDRHPQEYYDEIKARFAAERDKRLAYRPPGTTMYTSDLAGAETRLRDFLVGRFGGPQRYIEQRGHPRLRARHVPFAIDRAAAERWLTLMDRAIDGAGLPAEVASRLHLVPRRAAIEQSHFPPNEASLEELNSFRSPPQRRLIFEEFFLYQIGYAWRRHATSAELKPYVPKVDERVRAAAARSCPSNSLRGSARPSAKSWRTCSGRSR